MPFARWPNNDLWNLLPSDAWLNDLDRQSAADSLERVNSSQRFFAEANIALPGLNADNNSVDDLFEALLLQRGRLKEMQQLREWLIY